MTISSILSGVTLSDLPVVGGETLEVLLGGSAAGVTVSAGGSFEVSSGGWAGAVTVQSGGAAFVLAGGSASGTTVDSGGNAYVSGGTATVTVLSGGTQSVVSGGIASGTTVDSGGAAYLSGGSAIGMLLSSGGFAYVGSGGVASDTVVTFDADAFVLSGGVASGTTVSSGGIAYVSGGSVFSTLLASSGFGYVVSGGTATSSVVEAGAALFVSLGGVASGTTVDSGGTEEIGVSGTASGGTISAGGSLEVEAGGVARSVGVAASGLVVVSSGGIASQTTLGAGATELVLSGGSALSTTVSSGGVLVVLSGGKATATVSSGGVVSSAAVVLQTPGGVSAWASSASDVTVGGGGTLYVASGGVVSGAVLAGGSDVVQGGSAVATVATGGSETVLSGGVVSSSTVGAGGVEAVSAGGTTVAAQVTGGGMVLVSSGGVASGTVLGAGGSAVISTGGSAGAMTIDAGGLLVLSSGATTYSSLAFAGSGGVLAIGGTLMPTVPISGLVLGDTIDLTAIAKATASLDTTSDLLTITSGGSSYNLQLAGSYTGDTASAVTDGTSGTDISLACFAAGTLIRTPDGDVPVETLQAGYVVLTRSGLPRPVRWVGRRRVACNRHPRPEDVQPIRIAAHAFARGQPCRDLLLSPDHAVFIGDVLIPVRYLVNGRTIAPITVASIDYLHVELDTHDVIFAEGLPAESFLDTGNRSAFADGGGATALHPDFALRIWEAKGCAELVLGGMKLADARRLLLARAAQLGHCITDSPGIAVFADGRHLAAEVEGPHWRVQLPAAVATVTLRSRTWIPLLTAPDGTDTRTLGVAISRVTLDGRNLALESPVLASGWHTPEPHWRWTDGAAGIDAAGVRDLRFTVAIQGRYWLPARDAPAQVGTDSLAPTLDEHGAARPATGLR